VDRPLPKPQELYRHFKGNLYQIVTIATHSESREDMVVYQALYGDYRSYVRPLDMFMSEVDRVKYPDVSQKYRFEKVERPSVEEKCPEPVKTVIPEKTVIDENTYKTQKAEDTVMEENSKIANWQKARDDFRKEPYKVSEVMAKTTDQEADELNLDPLVIKFLDTDLAADKNDILSKLRPIITNDMIDIMAMSLGVVVEKGDVYDRFNDLRTCLTTIEKFESSRLRS
jgi:hypothetical protein